MLVAEYKVETKAAFFFPSPSLHFPLLHHQGKRLPYAGTEKVKIIKQFSIFNQNGHFPFDYKLQIKLLLFHFLWRHYKKAIAIFQLSLQPPSFPMNYFHSRSFQTRFTMNWHLADTQLIFPFPFWFSRAPKVRVRRISRKHMASCTLSPYFLCKRMLLWKDRASNPVLEHLSAPSSHGAHPPSPQMVSVALLCPYQDLRGNQRQVQRLHGSLHCCGKSPSWFCHASGRGIGKLY